MGIGWLTFHNDIITSEGQEMGTIAPAPENARKKI
jgi:hypothetical protein